MYQTGWSGVGLDEERGEEVLYEYMSLERYSSVLYFPLVLVGSEGALERRGRLLGVDSLLVIGRG
jgi:hypothetical protein